MAIPFIIERRRLIPNWRSFKSTLVRGELSGTKETHNNNVALHLFNKRIDQWKSTHDQISAIELLNSAIVLGFTNYDEVKEAAEFTLENPKLISISLISLANKVLQKITNENVPTLAALESFEEFEEFTKKEKLYNKINSIKRRIENFPRNPILWVELARYYSIIGQLHQAKKAIKVAYNLAPENRFVLRSFTRLFVHSGDYDIAHDVLRKSSLVKLDPWITSAEIAVASLRERQSKFINYGLQMVSSKKFNPFSITELTSGIATVELENGSVKKSRALFEKSLVAPNDNSVAQAEWASQEERKLQIIIPQPLIKNSYEALTYECYDNNDWKGVIENCLNWFVDIPHSKTAVIIGHHVSSIFLKDHEVAIKFCKAGLISHPNNPSLLNNLAYSLTLLNRTEEAMAEIKLAESNDDASEIDLMCLKATKGLIHLRRNQVSEGRKYYIEAMNDAKKLPEQYYFILALLNFTKEEILLESEESSELIKQVDKLNIDPEYKDLIYLKHEILNLKNRKSSATSFWSHSDS